ncbi:BatD family protein [Candidatus Omnitrophota bacterium]
MSGSCGAEEITFEATVNKTAVSLNDRIELSLTFQGASDVTTPYFPGVDGFDWRYSGPSHLTSIINGEVSSSITHRYVLIPLRAGNFTIPSFAVQYRGQTYTSVPIPVEVSSGPVRRTQPRATPTPQAQLNDIEDRVFLIIQAGKRDVYVNEIIPVVIKLYVNNMALRDIQYPQISTGGFSLSEYEEPLKYQETIRGVLHSVIQFKTEAFATRAGELSLGPAELECNALVQERSRRRSRSSFFDDFFDDDFFGRYRTYPLSLSSAAIPITVRELPLAGKPGDFSGAIGKYRFSLNAEPKQVQVGDPITLKMTVFGPGNLKTVNPPELNFGDDFKIYEPDVQQDKQIKKFEQVIIPKDDRVEKIPQINFSFFDPESGEYKTLKHGPLAIEVTPLPEGEKMQVFEPSTSDQGIMRRKEILGRDIIYIKDAPGKLERQGAFLYKNKLFLTLLFLPLITVLGVLIIHKRRERLMRDVGYARKLRAGRQAKKNLTQLRALLDAQKAEQFFDLLFKTLQEYLGDKFHLASAGITSNVIEDLASRNLDQKILDKIQECFNACDVARYAPGSFSKADLHKTLSLLEEIFDQLQRIKT